MAKDKSQIDKFLEAARALEDVADEDYDDAVAKVAKAQKLTDEEIKALAKEARKKSAD
ncbi:F0F1-type ATP synthase delta subunit [Mesorhizobium sp. USDA 4775]